MPSSPGPAQPAEPPAAAGARRSSRPTGLIVLSLVLFCGWMIYPAVLTYTFFLGEKATATVAECEAGHSGPARGARDPDVCRGTWRTADGETGEGEIYNLDATEAEGRTYPIRIGPLGPYAHGWDRAWPAPAFGAVPLLILWCVCAFVYWKFLLPSRRAADGLLAAPGTLVVGADGWGSPDGTGHASVATLREPPPGHRPVDLPGRPACDGDQLSLGRKREKRIYQAVTDPDGRPLMYLEHRADRGLQPETVVSDPAGVPYLLLRRRPDHVLSYRLVDATGAALGTAGPAQRDSPLRLAVRDAAGNPAATAARRRGGWVVSPEEGAAPELRDAAIVLLLARAHDLD
ncbi:hypothetical protein [Actinomadura algeriensis]|uniref:DUF3592 domain-containing protein n=1 Tax=Actinomadura algeriensis TaxID=1679523 RepID=A0ABR9JUF6_9ACTN|nr:hypothetical protein [Actinomadura algeriensis]MBE1534044.1 hypothetical protein [Actinomadura algeriensis]